MTDGAAEAATIGVIGDVHLDNIAPSLLGGLVLCPESLLPETVRSRAPAG